MKSIIVINGAPGIGKDTFVRFVSNTLGGGVVNFSTVDKVKAMARFAGWDTGTGAKDRKFLSDLKKLTNDYSDMAFNDTVRAVADFKKSNNTVMFIHAREPEFITRIVSAFGAKTLLLRKMGAQIVTSNTSDENVENYDYDFIVSFGDIDDSLKKAKNFSEKFKDK